MESSYLTVRLQFLHESKRNFKISSNISISKNRLVPVHGRWENSKRCHQNHHQYNQHASSAYHPGMSIPRILRTDHHQTSYGVVENVTERTAKIRFQSRCREQNSFDIDVSVGSQRLNFVDAETLRLLSGINEIFCFRR